MQQTSVAYMGQDMTGELHVHICLFTYLVNLPCHRALQLSQEGLGRIGNWSASWDSKQAPVALAKLQT